MDRTDKTGLPTGRPLTEDASRALTDHRSRRDGCPAGRKLADCPAWLLAVPAASQAQPSAPRHRGPAQTDALTDLPEFAADLAAMDAAYTGARKGGGLR